jgi:hypothetical protein
VIRTRTVITALTLVSVLALGACSGDDPEPKFAPTPSTSAPTSPSTTTASGPTQPTMPTDATHLTESGAQAFLSYWFAALSHAMVSGDTGAVREHSDQTCQSCSALIEQIADLYSKGGRVETSGWTVEESVVNGDFSADAPTFLIRVNEGKRALFDGDKLVDRTPMAKVPMHVELSSATGSWLVSGVEILQ